MSKAYVCDQCDGTFPEVPFELCQALDEVDEDGDQISQLLHLCSTQCLVDYAVGIAVDFPEDA